MKAHTSRPSVIAGNWKMYKTIQEAIGYVETLTPKILDSQASVLLAVPFTALYPACEKAKELKSLLQIGAQNMNDATEGAFTGEIASSMLVDAGAQFVILGHSERRHLFQETSAFVNRKVKQAVDSGLTAIVCVGETLEQRKKRNTTKVLKEQLLESLEGLSSEDLKKVIIAYEPVWAIGTGKVAKPADAQTAHHFCRELIAEHWGEEAAAEMVLQYGGSVKPDNAAILLEQEDIDGLLVGGASLSAETFSEIIHAA